MMLRLIDVLREKWSIPCMRRACRESWYHDSLQAHLMGELKIQRRGEIWNETSYWTPR